MVTPISPLSVESRHGNQVRRTKAEFPPAHHVVFRPLSARSRFAPYMTTTLGIDPGKAGAIAAIGDGIADAYKMPATVGDLCDLLRSLACQGVRTAYIERVHSSPQMGVVSAFTFGRGLGNLEAVCQCVGIRVEWVAPATWQKALGCLSHGDKNVTKRRAQELFPTMTITHATADALLIGEFGRRAEAGRSRL